MRVAEYVLPRAAGDTEDGELIVYFFGGSGGSVDANIERWLGQMQQPDGRASRDVATRSTRVINGLNVTTLDLAGTYTSPRYARDRASVTTSLASGCERRS